MIYLDNAATTYPKPDSVYNAFSEAAVKYGANPGRSGHAMAALCSEKLYECRRTVGEFFGQYEPERVIFTPGCTWSVNIALKGLLRAGDHVIISDMEHNAVVRPLNSLEKAGVSVSRARVVCGNDAETVENFNREIRKNTRMIFTTHASNVFGVRVPIEALSRLCVKHNIVFGVDAAQTAGIFPIDMSNTKIDMLCIPAHKGLYGIMGQGALLLSGNEVPMPLAEGGTGSLSKLRAQPDELPDRFESGTLNMPGICAMATGAEFVRSRGVNNIARHEMALMQRLYDYISAIRGAVLYTSRPDLSRQAPLLSFNIKSLPSEKAGELLSQRGFAVRAGYHCAYDAHIKYRTEQAGTLRVCPSAFTKVGEIENFADAVSNIAIATR